MCWHTEHLLAASPRSACDARTFLLAELAGVLPPSADELRGDAELIVSELVTNAIQANANVGLGVGTILMTLKLHHDTLRIAVTDHAPGRPARQPFSAAQPGGRGLILVDALATSWGVTETADGKTVWAVLPVNSVVTTAVACIL